MTVQLFTRKIGRQEGSCTQIIHKLQGSEDEEDLYDQQDLTFLDGITGGSQALQ